MGASESTVLLDKITCCGRAESARYALQLFDQFDTDQNGRLEGYEMGRFVETVSQYLLERIKATEKTKRAPPDDRISRIRFLVHSGLDCDRNGVITRQELVQNLRDVLRAFSSAHSECRCV